MSASIADILLCLESSGSFAARLSASATDLEIHVKGVGPLSLPLTSRDIERLRRVARPAPFGLRERTLHDPAVRDTAEITASRVRIGSARWKLVFNDLLCQLRAALG